MMTDKKFDKVMAEAKDILDKMPEAHNFSHRTVYNPAALTTSWYLEDSKIKEHMGPWGAVNPVESFVIGCEHAINALMGALKEMAGDYDSLEQQYNEYKAMRPDEKAKMLYDHVNGRGVHLIDILVDSDKAHIKMENDRLPEGPVTTLEEINKKVQETPITSVVVTYTPHDAIINGELQYTCSGCHGLLPETEAEQFNFCPWCGSVISECDKINRSVLAAWLKNKEETPKTAHWIEECDDDGTYHCSACQWHSSEYWIECPNCHAKMETVTRDYGEDENV